MTEGSSGARPVNVVRYRPRLADAHVLQAEDRERLGRIVIAGVVAERAFHRGFRGRDGAFEHDLRAGRHMQRDGAAGRKLGPPPAQEAGKGKLAHAFGRRHDGGENAWRDRRR